MTRAASRSLLVTGASSGLGAALALSYAAPGVSLALTGRNTARLDATARGCRDRGAAVRTATLDVGEAGPVGEWVLASDDAAPLDLVIAAAGLSGGPQPGEITEGVQSAVRQIRTNLLGAMHVVEPLLPRLLARRAGHVALVSSVAGYRGLPYSPAYSASKAGIRAYGDGLRAALAPHRVACSVVVPGFIDTPMTDHFIGDKPFMMPLERAVAIVRRGLDRRRGRIVFPRLLGLGLQATELMPAVLGDMILRSHRFHIRHR